MTECDGFNVRQTTISPRDPPFGQSLASSGLTSVSLSRITPLVIAATDSEGDYETSSEGHHSPRAGADCRKPSIKLARSTGGTIVPQLVDAVLFPEEDSVPQNELTAASNTIVGTSDSPRIDLPERQTPSMGSRNPSHRNEGSEVSSSTSVDVDEMSLRRTEYFVAPKVESDANKSESLPVIRVATPWGSYEYPDVHIPAERLVSDSPVDIREKMRLIAACMDGSNSSGTTRFHDESRHSLFPELSEDADASPRCKASTDRASEVEISGMYRRPVSQSSRSARIRVVNSLKDSAEALNVLPITRNSKFASDYTFSPSLSGASMPPATPSNEPLGHKCSTLCHRELESQRLTTTNKSYDPLSRIEGELGPLQNELSEIRGKVRALNLDYNLSCINGMIKLPKMVNWMRSDILGNPACRPQVTPVKDDFILSDYFRADDNPVFQNETKAPNVPSNHKVSDFDGTNYATYRCPFVQLLSAATEVSPTFYGLKDLIEAKSTENTLSHPGADIGVPVDEIGGPENCNQEMEWPCFTSPLGCTDRKLSSVHICTASPPRLDNPKPEVGTLESEKKVAESSENHPTAPEIRLPDFLDRICIVPISYIGPMPDPPAEPVFSFSRPEEDAVSRAGHKVLRIEHPDVPFNRRDQRGNRNVETSSSSSGTVLTCERPTDRSETSMSSRREQDDFSNESSLCRGFDRIGLKFVKRSSRSHSSTFTRRQQVGAEEPFVIRGLICGPEDFL